MENIKLECDDPETGNTYEDLSSAPRPDPVLDKSNLHMNPFYEVPLELYIKIEPDDVDQNTELNSMGNNIKTEPNQDYNSQSDEYWKSCKKSINSYSISENHKAASEHTTKKDKDINGDTSNNTIQAREKTAKSRNSNYRNKKSANLYTCDVCKKQFSVKNRLLSHYISHSNEKLFSCDLCGTTFKYKRNIISHLLIHTGEKRFKCDLCDARFRQSDALKVHHRKHTGEKPFSCNFCNKKYGFKYNLKLHMFYKHTDENESKNINIEKPYNCEICNAKFRNRGILRQHLKCHSDVRPFACHLCPATFRFKAILKQHVFAHEGIRPFGCDLCSSKFRRKSHLEEHKRNVHKII